MDPREYDGGRDRGPPGAIDESEATAHRRTDGWSPVTIDLVLALCGIAVALIAVPLFVGYTLALGTVPPTDSVAFYGLVGAVMTPGPLMGAVGCWLAARSDPA